MASHRLERTQSVTHCIRVAIVSQLSREKCRIIKAQTESLSRTNTNTNRTLSLQPDTIDKEILNICPKDELGHYRFCLSTTYCDAHFSD